HPPAAPSPRYTTRVDERAYRILDEERIAASARDDLVAQLRGHPVERRLDDPRGLLVRERLEHQLAEVGPHRSRLRCSGPDALRQEQQDRDTRGTRGDEPEELEGRRIREVEVLEDVEERPLARECGDDVVDGDEHRALPLLGLARRLSRPYEMEELRKRRDHHLRICEAELAQARAELGGRLRVV